MIRAHHLWLVLLWLSLTSPGMAVEPMELPKGILQLEPYSAPTTELKDLDGEPYNLKEDKGAWVFVHFWASWCGPCRKEMPAIQKVIEQMQGKPIAFYIVNTAEDEDTVFSFLATYAPGIRALLDRDGLVTEKWQPRGLPATYIVDQNGYIRFQALGGRPWDEKHYLDFLRNLMKQGQ